LPQNLNEEGVKSFLQKIGLCKYEIQAYLPLVKHGPQEYTGLIELSGVPYGKIYATLGTLGQKGWVEASKGRPKISTPWTRKAPSESTWTGSEKPSANWRRTTHESPPNLEPSERLRREKRRKSREMARHTNCITNCITICSNTVEFCCNIFRNFLHYLP